jgi:hypothetical protein
LTPGGLAVDRAENDVFRHLGTEDMSAWLDDYSLGELWEKKFRDHDRGRSF